MVFVRANPRIGLREHPWGSEVGRWDVCGQMWDGWACNTANVSCSDQVVQVSTFVYPWSD